MKIKNLNYFGVLLAAVLLSFSACKKDDNPVDQPDDHNDEELITTLMVILSDSTGVLPTDTFTFRDIDGPGGNAPEALDTITLKQSQTYFCEIQVWNESESPAENITEEIEEEAKEHLFCFEHTQGNLKVVKTDSDGSLPIGLKSTWYSYASDQSSVTISLKHQPGVKDGTCSPGETDIQVQFPLRIQ